jgi:hypothetical protein
MNKDRFDLEQEILDCWHIVDDLDVVINSEQLNLNDDMLNILIGLKQLYQLKFERTFQTFEQLVSKRELDKHIL